MNKPPIEEAKKDLDNLRQELLWMKAILTNVQLLSTREDVDSNYYGRIFYKLNEDIIRGEGVARAIIARYPELI